MDKLHYSLILSLLVLIPAVGVNFAWDYNSHNQKVEEVDLTDYAPIDWVLELQVWNKNNFERVIDAKANRTTIHEDHAILMSTVNDLKTEVAILKAQSDIPGLPKTPRDDVSDFDLELSNAQGVFKAEFNRGEVVLITGESDESKRNSRIIITDPNGMTVKDKSFNTYSDGTFTESFITDNNTVVGKYTITITIKSLTDSITFRVS